MWARIAGGVVAELTDTNPAGRFHPALVWADLAAAGETQPGLGWHAMPADAGWQFSPPPAPPAPPPAQSVTPLEFMARFNPAERQALAGGALADAELFLWFWQSAAAQQIDLADARTIAGMQALVDAGVISPARRAEILTA